MQASEIDGGSRGPTTRTLPTLLRTVVAAVMTVATLGTLGTPARAMEPVRLRPSRPASTRPWEEPRAATPAAPTFAGAAGDAGSAPATDAGIRTAGFQNLEPRLRQLVADQLAVDADALVPEVSLTDELAVDSLDMVGLVLAIEDEFDVMLSERSVDGVRTYGELVAVVASGDRPPPERAVQRPLTVWSRMVPSAAAGRGILERVEELTPYALETIAEDARRAGPGARLEIVLPADADEAGLTVVASALTPLGRRGVETTLRRAAAVGLQEPRPGRLDEHGY